MATLETDFLPGGWSVRASGGMVAQSSASYQVMTDLDVSYRFDDENDHLPARNRFAHPMASAMHFETLDLNVLSYDKSMLTVNARNVAITAAGPHYAVTTTSTNLRYDTASYGYEWVKPSKRTQIRTHAGVEQSFYQVFATYQRVAHTSINDDGNSYSLAAVNSPFFRPLNDTDIKNLERNPRGVIKHLNKTLSGNWGKIVTAIDRVSPHGLLMNLQPATPGKTSGAAGVGVITSMLATLAHTDKDSGYGPITAHEVAMFYEKF